MTNANRTKQHTVSLPYRFTPRDYQLSLWQYFDSTDGPRQAIEIAHRRAGKDLNIWNLMIRETQKKPGIYYYFLPEAKQARRVIWQGQDNEGRRFLDYIPPEIIVRKRDNDMYIEFTNGSTLQILGSDRFDSIVGSNPSGVVFSEYAISDPRSYQFVRPILVANDGWVIFNTTPRGKNHAFDLFKMAAKSKDWHCRLITIEDTHKKVIDKETGITISVPVVSKEKIDREREEGTPEEIIQQEYYCSFDAGQIGSYYSEAMAKAEDEGRILSAPSTYNPKYPVYTACDLGVSDTMAVWYFQVYENQSHIIEYNEFTGRSTIDLCYILQGDFDPLYKYLDGKTVEDLRQKYSHHKDYNYHSHFAPHDIAKRDQGTALSNLYTASKHGINFKKLPQTGLMEGINNVRKVLPYAVFCEPTTRDGIACLRNYRKKYDYKNNVFLDTPLHDWASHGSDGFRYLSQAITQFIDKSFLEKASKAKREYNRQQILKTENNPIRLAQQEREQFLQEKFERVFPEEDDGFDESEYALH